MLNATISAMKCIGSVYTLQFLVFDRLNIFQTGVVFLLT